MPELFDQPLLLPVLISFIAGVFLTAIISSFCGGATLSASREREKAARTELENQQIEVARVQDNLAASHASEAVLSRRLGELETQVMSEQKRQEEMAQFLAFAKSTLQTELRKNEHSIVNALQASAPSQESPPALIPPPMATSHDDRDFVPLPENPREESFEGFAVEPTSQKAESAANVLRAALENPES